MSDDFFHSYDSFESIDLHSIVIRPSSLINEYPQAQAKANAQANKKYNLSFNKRAKVIPYNEKQYSSSYRRFFCFCKKK
jgi:hypothetical protein